MGKERQITATRNSNINKKWEKATVQILQVTNLKNCSSDDLDLATIGKPEGRNYIKAKIYNMQKNRKYWLYRDRDEKINNISDTKEIKRMHDWVGKGINWV